MIGWLIAAGVILAIGLIRIGAQFEYSEEGIHLDLNLMWFLIKLLPGKAAEEVGEVSDEEQNTNKEKLSKKKEKPSKKQNKSDPPKEESGQGTKDQENSDKKDGEKKEKKGGLVDILLSAISPAFDAIGTFIKHLKITKLAVHYTAAGKDPFDTVMSFGYASAAMGVLTPILDNLHIKDRDFRTSIDFQLEKPIVYVRARLSMALWEYFYVAFRLVFKFLARFIKRKIKRRKASKGA